MCGMGNVGLMRRVLSITWPMIISELSDSMYSIADTYFVARLGATALAAVAIGSYLSWLFFVVIALFSMGALVIVSQSYGAKEIEKAREAIGISLIYGFIATLLTSILMYVAAYQAIELISGKSPQLIELAVKYFRIRILGLPVFLAAFVMDSAVRAVGATKLSMIAILTSSLLNIVLDPIMIYGLFGFPAMGVSGAALATVLSIAYMVPIEFMFLRRLGLTPIMSLSISKVKNVVKIGAPAATERLIFSVGNNAYIAFIARCGDVALAAHQIGVRIESFIYMPGFAFSIAASALTGQEIGKGDVGSGKRVGWEAAKLSLLFMGVLGVAVALASKYLVAPFSPTEDVANLASIYLVLAGLSEPGLALAMTLSGAIRGGGNTLIPMILNAVGLYSFRVFPAAVLTSRIGVVGAWIAMFIDVYMRGFLFLVIYRRLFEKLIRRVI